MKYSLIRGALTASTVLFLVGCSGSGSFSIGGESIKDAGEELVTGELADQLALGELEAECEEVPDGEVGSTFTCTGTTSDGQVINFDGEVDAEDHIILNSTNVVAAENVEEVLAANLSAQRPDIPIAAENVDCGDGSLVVVDSTLSCEVAPQGSTAQTATLTFTDLKAGEFDYVIE